MLRRLTARLRAARERRRWVRTWRGTLWSRRAGVVAALAVAVGAIALALASLSLLGVGRDLGRTLVLNTATAVAVGALAYMWFVTRTRRRALGRILDVARLTPEELFFPVAGVRAPVPIGRDRLVEALANDLRKPFRAAPEIVVGETGAGKTTVLLALARYLAERGVVPIPVSLRAVDREHLDFTTLAHDRFADLVDPYVESTADAERVWRSLCIEHALVVLADDLDGSSADEEGDHRRTATRRALERAYDRELPLVVTSRREGIPPALDQWAIELDELEVDDDGAVDHVIRRAGKHPDEIKVDVEEVVREGALRENPFYLETAAALLAVDRLPPSPGGDRRTVRVALLDAYREALIDGTVAPDARMDEDERKWALGELEDLAVARLLEESVDPEWRLLDSSERLGLLEVTDPKGSFRFSHQVVHAYLASRALRTDTDKRDAAIVKGPCTPLVQLALVLASASAEGSQQADHTCRRLRDVTADLPPDARLLTIATVAEIAEAAGYEELDEELAEECDRLRPVTGRLARLAAVRQLATLDKPSWMCALWEYAAHDDDYGVRWQAAAGLASHGRSGFRALEDRFAEILANADALAQSDRDRRTDAWDEATAPLKHMGWVLPSLRTAALRDRDEDAHRDAQAALDRLYDLEGRAPGEDGIAPQRAIEASVAQGLKVDALRFPTEPVDKDAVRFLKDGVFWYSRVNAIHAVAARGYGNPANWRDAVDALRLALRDPNRLVRAAAQLALKTREPADARGNRFIWDDEGMVVAHRPSHLDPRTAQLVGDMTVLLNMNEPGSWDERLHFGQEDSLPPCFARSRDREQVLHGSCTCGRGLCPYRAAERPQNAAREISRAFARHQRATATHKAARRWGVRAKTSALRDFWAQIEARARF